jgi:hypothetical protein
MNKLIYFENEFINSKESLEDLQHLRIEILAEKFSDLERIEIDTLIDLLSRINKCISYLKDK